MRKRKRAGLGLLGESHSFNNFLDRCEASGSSHITIRNGNIKKDDIVLLSKAFRDGRLKKVESLSFGYGACLRGNMNILEYGLCASSHTAIRRLKFTFMETLNADADTVPLINILKSQAANLEELEFESCLDSKMARDVFKALANSNSQIKKLEMLFCDINETHGRDIRKMLENCTSLQHLDLSHNKLGNIGVKVIAEGLKRNSTLLRLNVNSNDKLTDIGVAHLAEALEENNTLQYLHFADENKICEGGIVDGVVRLVKALVTNTSIRELKLKSEAFHGTVLKDGSAFAIADMLQKNKTLKSLDVTMGKFTKKAGMALLNAFHGIHGNTSVKKLDLSAVRRLPYQSVVDLIHKNKTITDLDIGETYFTKEVPSSLSKFKKFVDAVKNNTTLQSLNLGYNNLKDAFVCGIAHAFTDHPSLTSLSLSNNYLTDKSVVALMAALERCGLERLFLQRNHFKSDGALAIANYIKKCTTLTVLNISYNDLGKNGMIAIANAIKQNTETVLADFKVHHTYIDQECTDALCDMILNNNTIEHLDIMVNDYNNFDYDRDHHVYVSSKKLKKFEAQLEKALKQNPYIMKPIPYENQKAFHICYLYKQKANFIKKISNRILRDILSCPMSTRGTIFGDGKRHM